MSVAAHGCTKYRQIRQQMRTSHLLTDSHAGKLQVEIEQKIINKYYQ